MSSRTKAVGLEGFQGGSFQVPEPPWSGTPEVQLVSKVLLD